MMDDFVRWGGDGCCEGEWQRAIRHPSPKCCRVCEDGDGGSGEHRDGGRERRAETEGRARDW